MVSSVIKIISVIVGLLFFAHGLLAQGTSPACASLPSSIPTPTNARLPNPFKFLNDTNVETKAQWSCRREEIRSLIQRFELGTMPPKPSSVAGSLSSNTLSITVREGGKSIYFSASIKYPTTGTASFPAVIGYGGGSILVPSGVAQITYNNFDVGADLDRGKGKFYDLYGSGHDAGAMIAWAWETSRIIDALETTANVRIDPKRVGVTGCSRNGKGAMVAGAFDDRIALTIPQEGGSGSAACWRITDQMKRDGVQVETAAQIVNGDAWFATKFLQYVNQIPVLPHDHHGLTALVAPQGLLIVENSGIDYLAPLSSYGCSKAGQKVFTALGVGDAFGFTQNSHGSSHCGFPSAEQPELTAYANKYLLGRTAAASVFKMDGKFNWVESQWIDWQTPTLT